MKRKLPPVGIVPLSKVVPSSLVTVCGADDTFFQITVVPAVIVSDVGLKPKLPSLLVTIMITCVPDTGAECGVGTCIGVAVGVVPLVAVTGAFVPPVGAVALALVVLLPPHAASKIIAPITNRQNQTGALRSCEQVFFSFIFTLSCKQVRMLTAAASALCSRQSHRMYRGH